MIESLLCRNFKGLSGLRFGFRALTILTGMNGAGKSSVHQAILLAHLSVLSQRGTKGGNEPFVPLNGPFDLALGELADVLTHDADPNECIEIHLTIDGVDQAVQLAFDDPSARYLRIERPLAGPHGALGQSGLGEFSYLGAEREGPRDFQPAQSLPKGELQLGSRGQHIAEVLDAYERDPVLPELENPAAKGLAFAKQVEGWLASLLGTVALRVEKAPGLGLVAVRFKRDGTTAEWMRPSNTGFGITQCLPVLAAALLSKPGSVLLLDSPEVHLHPAGQSAMGRFLALLAAAHIQVVVETHSDHLLNGIRLAAIDDAHPLARDQVLIHFLACGPERITSQAIHIEETGALSSRPTHFFDQSEKDLSSIIRKRRSKI